MRDLKGLNHGILETGWLQTEGIIRDSSSKDSASVMGARKSRSGFGVLRLTQLENINEDEEVEVATTSMDVSDSKAQETTTCNEPRSSAVTAKGKRSQEEEAVVVLSHPSITVGMRSFDGVAMDSVRGALSVTQRLSKEKTLRDITNRLETKLKA